MNDVTIKWVQGSICIDWNVIADKLSRRGCEANPVGPKPTIGINNTFTKSEVRKWLLNIHRTYRDYTAGMRQSKLTLKEHVTETFLNLSRNYITYRFIDRSLPSAKALPYHWLNFRRTCMHFLWFFPRNCTTQSTKMRRLGLQEAFAI